MTAAVIAAVPLLVLLLVAVAVPAAAPSAALAALVVALSGGALAWLWQRDLGRVVAGLRGLVEGRARVSRRPHLPWARAVLRDAAPSVQELVRQVRQMEALRHRDDAIFEHLAHPLIILGAKPELRRANRAAVREFGPEAAAMLRHPVLRAAIDRARATGTQQAAEIALPVPVLREVQATICLLNPGSGDGLLMVLLTDRTRERTVERMRTDFIANASHELRTPLCSLIGFIETLRGPAAGDPRAQQRFLGIMAEQAGRMQRLIDDLLSLSRIELVEHLRPGGSVDLAGLAEQAAAAFEPAVLARRATLALALDAGLPQVAGDADQLAQVVQNLLDNALKYGAEGVSVRLAVAAPQPGERWPDQAGVVLSISDTGPGIAPEHLPRLTERFYRADKGRSRSAGGTGLGLAIVKHIVNRHRGQLRIESMKGTGSAFHVWLPAA